MTLPIIEIELTFEDIDTIEKSVIIDPSVNTVEEFIEKYSVLAAQEMLWKEGMIGKDKVGGE